MSDKREDEINGRGDNVGFDGSSSKEGGSKGLSQFSLGFELPCGTSVIVGHHYPEIEKSSRTVR